MSTPQERAEQAARDLTRAVNEMSFDAKAFAAEIRREHRTTQQAVFRAFATLIEQWADDFDTGNFDLRNHATVELAKNIVYSVDNLNTPYI